MSGYLEGDEIDAFLKDMLQHDGQNPNPQRIADYKCFMVRLFYKLICCIIIMYALKWFIMAERAEHTDSAFNSCFQKHSQAQGPSNKLNKLFLRQGAQRARGL